ncbi:MAG: alpha-amylase family glycosyl hydrolase [Candidatus Paceibacterota bacterium]|jgi:maltose alpha-D-glucosyltransferase/alpha-amylase
MIQKDPFWWKKAKIYELYVDKFAHDFKGLTAKLDYFTSLGINCLHILPHYPSPMIDDGYDVSNYRDVRPELGNLLDMKEMINEAHKRGIRVITDLVLNHVSQDHPWFQDARSSKDSSKRDYFLWSKTGLEFEGATNAFPDMKDSNWISNSETEDFYFATFYPEQPDLNWNNEEVLHSMLSIMDFWIQIGVDGFRLDAAPYLIKREGTTSKGLPETHQILKKIRKHLDNAFPGTMLLAEVHMSVEESKKYFGDGDECQMVYHFPLAEELWLALMRNDTKRVESVIQEASEIPEGCEWATFLRNHDEISLHLLSPEDHMELIDFLDPRKEYVMKKMRKTSMRIASIFGGDQEKIIAAKKLLYSLPGAPILYYGDEIGMRNLPLQEGIIDTRKYIRGNFDWDEAEKQLKDPNSLLNSVAKIIEER